MKSRTAGDFLRLRVVIISLFVLLGISIFIATIIPDPPPLDFTPPPPSPISTAVVITTATLVTQTEEFTGTATVMPTATPTDIPDTIVYTIYPRINGTGWVQSNEADNHFGESFLYAGVQDDVVYHGAIQFILSRIPDDGQILKAELDLTGLRDDELQISNVFALNVLTSKIDRQWPLHDYTIIHNAEIEPISPILIPASNLAAGKINKIELSSAVRSLIENRLKIGSISFRIDTLFANEAGRFAWDTGYGTETSGNQPVLRLTVAVPSPVLPNEDIPVEEYIDPIDLVIITSTPTPKNQLTAVAIDLTATNQAEVFGPVTPLPPEWVTPWILESTPPPENVATAVIQSIEATIRATAFGTPTPLPPNAATVTATPTFFVVTSTPMPENVFTAVAQLNQLASLPTPLPKNWVTPFAVTSTPTPVNQATANYFEALFLTTGTPTPLPINAFTATPTPVFVLLQGELPPMTPTPTPTFTPGPIPSILMGKIAFKSDRAIQKTFINPATGGTEVVFNEADPAQIYVINPDGTGLALLTDRWPYELARSLDSYSIDGRFRVFTKDMIRYKTIDGEKIITVIDEETGEEIKTKVEDNDYERDDVPALYWYDAHYNVEEQLTYFGAGIAYSGAWSPTREQIVFVSNDSGNDEIWVVNRDGSELRQLTRDEFHWWDKDPSWSPDGNQIVFWSNRTGHGQIWIMDRDGSNLRSISRTGFNDWDPVWIKYPSVPQYTPPQ